MARVVRISSAVSLAVLAIAACGDMGEPARPGLAPPAATPPPPATVTPPPPAPFGLDARPANATCRAPARPPSASAVKLEQVFVDTPIFPAVMLTQPPGDPRVFIAQLNGQVIAFDLRNPPSTPPPVVLTPPVTLVFDSEGGFYGIAFHPRFSQNGLVFMSFTATSATSPAGMRSVVARMRSTDGGASFGEYTELLSFDQPANNHNGGGIAFGNDGYLYLGFGDGGGGGGDPFVNGQRKEGFFSKILRIDVDAPPAPGLAYAIPDGNPWKAGGGEPATYAWGLRNPYRISIDRGTGDLLIGDVGEGGFEEVDRARAPGANFGWPCREGAHDFITQPPHCPAGASGLTEPIHEYAHGPGGAAIVGGVVYRGSAIPSLVGAYVFGDFSTGQVWALDEDPVTGARRSRQINDQGPIRSWGGFSEDASGEIYALDLTGLVYKVVPAGAPAPSTFPEKLSQTGCVEAVDPSRHAKGVVPYSVNAELWSDGAEKERGFALPDGATIRVGADGDLDLPVGSVAMKTFRVAGRPVETRLMVRHDDGDWAGYTYEWDDGGRDATLLPAGKTRTIGGQRYVFPSRGECLACHTAEAGRTLGLELAQLDRPHTYASTGRTAPQLATLAHIGLFSGALPAVPALAGLASAAPVEARARAYLHANCSFCHRSGGPTPSAIDLRASLPLAAARVCGVAPSAGDLGVQGALLLAPGDPARSLLSVRMRTTTQGRMPPLASTRVHAEGTDLVDAWIRGITACPAP